MDTKVKEKPYINLPNGEKVSFSYLSRVANGEKPITLEKLGIANRHQKDWRQLGKG